MLTVNIRATGIFSGHAIHSRKGGGGGGGGANTFLQKPLTVCCALIKVFLQGKKGHGKTITNSLFQKSKLRVANRFLP